MRSLLHQATMPPKKKDDDPNEQLTRIAKVEHWDVFQVCMRVYTYMHMYMRLGMYIRVYVSCICMH